MARFLKPLAALASTALVAMGAHADELPDVRRLEAAGVRVLEGRYLRLLTDLPTSQAVDELPAVFDAAIPRWSGYFELPASATDGKKWQAFLIQDRELFASLGLLPEDNPRFINGYARDGRLWLVEQPSDYYRRHLLLHEGTHAFMQTMLGGCGPPWYMEGVAEFLGTHQWKDGKLELGVFPKDKKDVPMWGRIKLVREAFAAGEAWPIEQVMAVDNTRALSTESYAWTWALVTLLDRHPRYKGSREEIRKHILGTDPTPLDVRLKMMPDRNVLDWEWQTFVAQVDYGGYDFERMAVEIADETPNVIDAGRGWQATQWALSKGKTYRVSARGRYQIAGGDEPWMCEPGGVTIEYYDGKPLGILLGALTGRGFGDEGGFARPITIGLGTTITPNRDVSLYVRVNDSPAKLADNEGEVQVTVTQIAPGQ